MRFNFLQGHLRPCEEWPSWKLNLIKVLASSYRCHKYARSGLNLIKVLASSNICHKYARSGQTLAGRERNELLSLLVQQPFTAYHKGPGWLCFVLRSTSTIGMFLPRMWEDQKAIWKSFNFKTCMIRLLMRHSKPSVLFSLQVFGWQDNLSDRLRLHKVMGHSHVVISAYF